MRSKFSDMRRGLLVVTAAFAVSGVGLGGIALAQHAPDNSGVNKGQQVTADNQSGHMSDREITAKIRRDLVADKELSTYGHNVKIITRSGMVTLKGPVHTAEEKQAIEARATNVAGQNKVTDQLTIKQ